MKSSPLPILVLLALTSSAFAAVTNGPCPGCPAEHDKNDADVRKLLDVAVAAQNAQNNSENLTVVSINRITSQVVSGAKYEIDYQAVGGQSQKTYICHTVLHYQAWVSDKPQVLEHSCLVSES